MDTPERSQEGAQPRARPFAAIAVNLPHAITIVIARPLVLAVIDRRVG
jgi:hypothetical protein